MYYPKKNIQYELNPEIWGIEENLFRSSDDSEEDFSIGKYADFERQDQLGTAPSMGAYPLENSQINLGTTGQGNASQGAAQGTQVPGTGTAGFAPFIVDTEQQPLTSMGSEDLGFEPMMPMYPPMPGMTPQAQWNNQAMGVPLMNPFMQPGMGPQPQWNNQDMGLYPMNPFMQPGMGPQPQWNNQGMGLYPMNPFMQPGMGPQPQWNNQVMGFPPPNYFAQQGMGAYPPYLMSTLGQTNLPMMPATPIPQEMEESMGFPMNQPYPIGLWCYPMANPYMMNQGMLPAYPFMGPMMSNEEMMATDQDPNTSEGTENQDLMRHKKHKKKKKKVNKYSYYNCDVYGNPYSKSMPQHYGHCSHCHSMPYMWLSPFMNDMKEDHCCHHPHHHDHR